MLGGVPNGTVSVFGHVLLVFMKLTTVRDVVVTEACGINFSGKGYSNCYYQMTYRNRLAVA